jgi:mono/diheme cytochrome c family protein
MPRPLVYAFLILVALSLVPMAFLAKARFADSRTPRIQVVPDMDDQPKFKAQQANPLFADGRAMRPHVAGTVPRGGLDADGAYSEGRAGEDFVARSPVPVSARLLARGRERFDIFCATCHGLGGAGDGMIARRADQLAEGTWTPPTDLASETVRDRPDGHIFNTITHGIRSMPAYGPQIPVEDRWAIVAYLRALQRARGTTVDDVPEEIRRTLQ